MSYVTEQAQHFIVGSVVRNEESQVSIAQHGRYPNETSSATWNDTDILPGVFALLVLTMVLIIEIGNGRSEGFDTCSRSLRINQRRYGCHSLSDRTHVFTTSHAHVDGMRTFEAALDIIVDFGRALP